MHVPARHLCRLTLHTILQSGHVLRGDKYIYQLDINFPLCPVPARACMLASSNVLLWRSQSLELRLSLFASVE